MIRGRDQIRRLAWSACANARDLGGYETADGGSTRWGVVVRSDNLCRLDSSGRSALVRYGVTTVIDLRSESELALAPHPFARDDSVGYLSRPLLDERDAEGAAALEAAPSTREAYTLIVDRYAARVAAVAKAVADAPAGGVVVHCHAGKDRTGLVAALLLSLVGVPDTTVAEDYAVSDACLQPLYAEIMASSSADPRERARLAEQLTCRPETMLDVLSYLRAEHRGVARYLLESGLSQEDIERVRGRLLE